jgi:monofunctional chorismate mutase
VGIVEGPGIEEARRAIDRIDEEIIRLLDARMEICREIGRAKRMAGAPIDDKEREERVLERAGDYRSVFREIIVLCKEAQREVAGRS